MGLIFRHHAESAQLTARKVGISGLISFRAEPLSLRRSWSTGMKIPWWHFQFPLKAFSQSTRGDASHLCQPRSLRAPTQIPHPVVASPRLWHISPPRHAGSPAAAVWPLLLRSLSVITPWTVGSPGYGLIPPTRGGSTILTLISWLQPPPSLTAFSRPVFHTHHQHPGWTFPQADKWHQIKEH